MPLSDGTARAKEELLLKVKKNFFFWGMSIFLVSFSYGNFVFDSILREARVPKAAFHQINTIR